MNGDRKPERPAQVETVRVIHGPDGLRRVLRSKDFGIVDTALSILNGTHCYEIPPYSETLEKAVYMGGLWHLLEEDGWDLDEGRKWAESLRDGIRDGALLKLSELEKKVLGL